MPLWLRRIIYWSFIILFLLVAPIISLYSMGYRYHWGKYRLERTGLIVVDGTPRDATVRIDGVVRAQRLPARIGGLNENEYTVRIERDGFHPWEQRVFVASGRTALATDIFLFRDASPTLELAGTITRSTVSADGAWLAFTRRLESLEELWIVDLSTDARTLAFRSADRITFSWSPQDATLLVTTASDVFTIDPHDARRPRSLSSAFPRHPSSVTWELGSANALVAVIDGRLRRVSLLTGRAVPLSVVAPNEPFAVARGLLLTAVDRALIVTKIDDGTSRTIDTGGASITSFVALRGSVLTAETGGSILDIELTAGNVRTRTGYGLRMNTRHSITAWFGSIFESWEESGDPPQPRLLARRDAPIIDVAWHSKAPYAFIATARDITAIDRAVPTRKSVPLATFEDIRAIAISRNGASLLIIGRSGTTEGLWTLPLR